jgi:hypothetical protein
MKKMSGGREMHLEFFCNNFSVEIKTGHLQGTSAYDASLVKGIGPTVNRTGSKSFVTKFCIPR